MTIKKPTTPVKRAPRVKAPTEPAVAKVASEDKGKVRKLPYLFAVGRRKRAVARTRLFKNGQGVLTVNTKPYDKYFQTPELQLFLTQALDSVGLRATTDISIKVAGGGMRGQAEACRHGISRALLLLDPEYRKTLKPQGFLRRDPREKERKKPGLRRARRAPQWQKR